MEKKEEIPFLENVSVLIFRLVWKFQKTKPEIENSFTCGNIRPEVLANLKSFPKPFRNTSVGVSYFGKLSTNNSAVL